MTLRFALCCAAATALAAAFLAPTLAAKTPFASVALYAGFSPFCHQEAARSLLVDGLPTAVCARCLGVLAGAAVTLFAAPQVPKRLLLAALLLAAAAWTAELIAPWPPEARFLAGAPLGLALAAPLAESSRRRILC